ncbi:hypothetical protein B9Z55_016303 [Caenorhabditis nigoni]|uniref:Uncharacterized protein n=1 Tax=Caenorhabditis nigoni TaxID=1611254 RepID=A0A2G5T4P9_9PELO|nr:hypothetical protein B9Z55_016303 [Caenorhabditis nigoni]
MIPYIFLILLPTVSVSQYYNPSLYQSYLNSGVQRQQTVLVPVYTQGGYGGAYGGAMGGYPGYGMSYPAYQMGYGYPGGGYPMIGGGACCGGGGMMPPRESNAKKFLRGATEGVFMGSVGMLGFRK